MTLGRRELLQVAAATAALGASSTGLAQPRVPTQEDLLRFKATGQVTLLNFTDLHAQLVPLYFREPSANLGVGADKGLESERRYATRVLPAGVARGLRDALLARPGGAGRAAAIVAGVTSAAAGYAWATLRTRRTGTTFASGPIERRAGAQETAEGAADGTAEAAPGGLAASEAAA